MRLLFGIIIGGLLTVGGAYVYDSNNVRMATTAPTTAERTLVNWDVVGTKWDELTQRARAQIHQLTS
ncbi:MAG: hypothetical protein Q8M26_16450 [Pseudolabrys sp.]|nr:hypothetical protein [Pseudolabrys sp.]